MRRFRRWRGEPRKYADIEHVQGCISVNGCRCSTNRELNPVLPEYMRDEGHWLDYLGKPEEDRITPEQ